MKRRIGYTLTEIGALLLICSALSAAASVKNPLQSIAAGILEPVPFIQSLGTFLSPANPSILESLPFYLSVITFCAGVFLLLTSKLRQS